MVQIPITWDAEYEHVYFGRPFGETLVHKLDTDTVVHLYEYDDGYSRHLHGRSAYYKSTNNNKTNKKHIIHIILCSRGVSYIATISTIISMNQPMLIINRSS